MLNEKVAIITGGSNGIGKATVLMFVDNGAKVVIWDRDIESGKELENELKNKGHEVRFDAVDITDFDNCRVATERVIQEFGRIDILVNNAGITKDSTLKKMSSDQWQAVLDVNLTGVFNCTRNVAPIMMEAGKGRIMNAASVVGLYGNFGQTNYVATKAGVIGMTKVWAREFGKYGVCVNAVAPGFIQTEMLESIPDHILDMMKNKSPLRRLGEVNDIANAYLYLASDMASYVTGTTLSVDGGVIT